MQIQKTRLPSILLLASILTGCATHRVEPSLPRGKPVPAASPAIPAPAPLRNDARSLQKQLDAIARQWEGTPYRFGGNDENGIDCSALVQNVYLRFGIDVGRTTGQQRHAGSRAVSPRPGDLLVFRTRQDGLHTGIYLGDGEFFHASSSIGVTRSRLDSRYWRKALRDIRRLPL